MGRGKKRQRQAAEEPAAEEPEGEIEGFVHEGELLLRDQTGLVYSSERDERGGLVVVGRWEESTATFERAAPPAPQPEPRHLAPPKPSTPHPPPQPLAFAAAEEDHCETAPEAYEHIAELLRLIAKKMGVACEELRIYDPYYCNGAVVRHLAALGFPNVYNENEDFYAAQACARALLIGATGVC